MLVFLCDYKIDIMDIWSLQNNLKNLSWMDIISPAILENSVHRGAMVLGSTKVILQEPQWDSNEKENDKFWTVKDSERYQKFSASQTIMCTQMTWDSCNNEDSATVGLRWGNNSAVLASLLVILMLQLCGPHFE